jgi:serine phosphatase RsbU (regulator of sigma subunit)
VTDAVSGTGERFGEARMLATIEATRRGSAIDVVNGLRDAVSAFRGIVPPADDITIVAIGRQA